MMINEGGSDHIGTRALSAMLVGAMYRRGKVNRRAVLQQVLDFFLF